MKLIVGLGNPGIEYQFTPHNLGFLVIDRLAEQYGARIANRQGKAVTGKAKIGKHDVLLAKPETYMNLSGMAVAELLEKHELDPRQDLIVVYDELALPFGSVRVREHGSSAGHNGMKSIMGALESDEFIRVRLGVAPERGSGNKNYLLSPFRRSQEKAVDALLDRAAEAVRVVLDDGVAAAMGRFNAKPEGSKPKRMKTRVPLKGAKQAVANLTEGHSVELLRHGTLQVLGATLRPTSVQTPVHTRDEVYVVAQGSGELVIAGQRSKFEAGDLMFVPAGTEHRWENFTDDLYIWVMFYGPEGGEKE